MMKVTYPAIYAKGNLRYTIYYPDLEGCIAESETMEDAAEKAQNALGLYLATLMSMNQPLPKASDPTELNCESNECVALITCDVDKYRLEKSVKKTLTIPGWLNKEAEKQNINFSAVLQKALKEELKFANPPGEK